MKKTNSNINSKIFVTISNEQIYNKLDILTDLVKNNDFKNTQAHCDIIESINKHMRNNDSYHEKLRSNIWKAKILAGGAITITLSIAYWFFNHVGGGNK